METDEEVDAQKKQREYERRIEHTCPMCGAPLIERKGKSKFLGCRRFPRCKYSRSLAGTASWKYSKGRAR